MNVLHGTPHGSHRKMLTSVCGRFTVLFSPLGLVPWLALYPIRIGAARKTKSPN